MWKWHGYSKNTDKVTKKVTHILNSPINVMNTKNLQ